MEVDADTTSGVSSRTVTWAVSEPVLPVVCCTWIWLAAMVLPGAAAKPAVGEAEAVRRTSPGLAETVSTAEL